jgi:hypothetical protein
MTQARPGNTANLKAAAARRHQAAAQRAGAGLDKLICSGEQVTFRAVARASGVSLEFLYSYLPIRSRIEHLRAQQQAPAQAARPATGPDEPGKASSVIRTLSAELTALKARHRAEVTRLRQELEAAHGENLLLRRRLGHSNAGTDVMPQGRTPAPPGT